MWDGYIEEEKIMNKESWVVIGFLKGLKVMSEVRDDRILFLI